MCGRRHRLGPWGGLLVSCGLAACTATLPPAPPELTQAPNCGEVRSGKIAWNALRPLDQEPSEAQRQAIEETLAQLARQLSGAEIRSLTRAANSLSNDTYSTDFQNADYAKTVGRVLDYRVLSVSRRTLAGGQEIRVEVDGRVCADDLVRPPLVVALGEARGVSGDALSRLEAALSRSFARNPRLALADGSARDTYHDIDVRASLSGPRVSVMDRSAAISAIGTSLGRQTVADVSRHATHVSVEAVLQATIHESGLRITEARTVERELDGTGSVPAVLIAGMEQEALELAGEALARTLSQYFAKARI